MQKLLLTIDKISTFAGQAFSWLIVALTLMITWEVFSRYALDHPHSWAFDVMIIMYGTLFMMAGGLHAGEIGARARRRAVRLLPSAHAGDHRPRPLPAVLHPGVFALTYAGYYFAAESLAIRETSNITAEGPPDLSVQDGAAAGRRHPLAQGIVEIIRCVICIRQGAWPSREEDVQEVDVDKLKEMVHVKDEDIAKLDKFVAPQGSTK
jgi:TRAP-type mannitol/chloroaromatic compound transport system permease small subunit